MSGHLYQPADRDGEGFMVHMLSAGSALLNWATYNDLGEAVWLTGTGRARDRVIQFDDLWHTSRVDETVTLERVGRASLAFTADEANPTNHNCRRALLRFHAEGDAFLAGSGRELTYLDGLAYCGENPDRDPLLTALDGSWYDPAQSGQGISLMPYADDRLLLNWYTYDEHGDQTWRIGIGTVASDGASIEFGPLLGVSGGSFDAAINPAQLEFVNDGAATLVQVDERWEFRVTENNDQSLILDLVQITAGPSLLASSGQRLDLKMHPDDVHELYTRDPQSDERLPGQVRFNGQSEVQDLTGLRFRGNTSRFHPKKSFNIRFEQPQDLLFGSDRMNLNAMYTDPAMMREALSFELFAQLGQPTSRTRHFDFWLNGIYEGLHIHIQRVDEWLLGMNDLNPAGTLVRDEFRDNANLPSSVFGYQFPGMDQAERLELLQNNFNHRGDPEWEHLLELIEWVNATPAGAGFAAGFDQWVNQDNFIDWLTLHWLIGDIDSFGDDYWLYLDHNDPEARWHFIPWDKDQSFGSHFRPGFFTSNDFFAYEYDLIGGWGNQLIGKFLQTPQLRQMAEARLLELIDELFTESWLHERIDAHAEVLEDSVNIQPSSAAFSRHNKNHHGELGRFGDQVESVRDFVSLRYRFIRARLAGENGSIDFAEGELPAGTTEALYLTDPSGFTLAVVAPLEQTATDSIFQIEVQVDPEVEGIDRVWHLDVTGEPGPVELTMFYRNDLENSAWGRGNWYTGGEIPVGQQGLLQILAEHSDGTLESLETRVNPLANKAVAVMVPRQGQYQIRLELPAEQ